MPNDMLAEVGRPSALEVRFEIQARWRDVVAAAGLDDAMHTPENTLMLAGAILHDAVITSLRMKPEFQIRQGAAFDTNWTKLFAAMGPNGRLALKDRIAKAHGGIGVTA
jgi:hypothetical protein